MFEQEGGAPGQGRKLRIENPPSPGLRASAAIRVAVAVSLAAAATAAAILLTNSPEPPTTDVVGYPIFSNFNIRNYFTAYYAIVGFFPVAALLIFLGLTRMGPRIGLAVPAPRGSLRPNQAPIINEQALEPQPSPSDVPRALWWAVRLGRTAFVGAVLGLEAACVIGHAWASLVLGAAAYALVAALVVAAWGKWGEAGGSLEARLAAVNAVAAPATIAGLVAVSAHTGVTIVSEGSVHGYPWFPAWLGLPIGIGLMGIVARRVRSAASVTRVLAIERRALLFLAAPVGLFLLLAVLPGDIGPLEMFESGQGLVGGSLLEDGWLPWRDVVLAHGIFLDAVNPILGFIVFGHSQWGRTAGYSLLTAPVYLVSTFLLFAYLFRRSIPFLLFCGLLILGTTFVPADVRFFLWPLILLLLAAVLDRPSRVRSVALALMVVIQALSTPEATPVVLAVAAVLALYEWYWREPGSPIATAFQRTLWFAGAGVVFAGAFAIYMASRGGLDDFIYISTALVQGHVLTGGISPRPIEESDAQYAFQALAPVAALLISMAYAMARLRLRRAFVTEDWVIAAAALFLIAYYLKFLSYMDSPHLDQVFGIALPLMLYIVYRATVFVEQWMRGRWARNRTLGTIHPVSLVLALTVAVIVWGRVEDHVPNAEARFRPAVSAPPVYPKVGYSSAPFDPVMYRDLKRVVDAYVDPSDRIFDFTNAPTLYYNLLDREPATRYLVVLVAHSEKLQNDLVDQLRESPPKLVVFDSGTTGLTNWDGIPNMVRHYAVSRWILDHYRPLLATHTTSFYVRRDMPSLSQVGLHLAEKPITRGVPFSGQPCTWGYAPNFLSSPPLPSEGARGVSARVRPAPNGVTVTGWAGDPQAKQPAREVIATAGGEIARRIEPGLARPDLVAYGLPKGFQRAGFQMRVPVERGKRLRVFAVSRSGQLSEIVEKGAKPAHGTVTIGGRTRRLAPNAVWGQLNSTVSERALRIDRPAGPRWSHYHWLELEPGPGGFRKGTFTVFDRQSRPWIGREISFQTLDSSPRRYIVPVGSCPQWHGYRGRRLYLALSSPQDVRAVRLIR